MSKSLQFRAILCGIALFYGALIAYPSFSAHAGTIGGNAAIVTIPAPHDFKTLVSRLEDAVTKNDMLVVAKASASAGAEKRGLKIPGDAVIMVFRNDFAVRMLQADAGAGLEAPMPIHVFEAPNGSVYIAYRRPSAVFGPYHTVALDEMARELDTIFDRIVMQATAR